MVSASKKRWQHKNISIIQKYLNLKRFEISFLLKFGSSSCIGLLLEICGTEEIVVEISSLEIYARVLAEIGNVIDNLVEDPTHLNALFEGL